MYFSYTKLNFGVECTYPFNDLLKKNRVRHRVRGSFSVRQLMPSISSEVLRFKAGGLR